MSVQTVRFRTGPRQVPTLAERIDAGARRRHHACRPERTNV